MKDKKIGEGAEANIYITKIFGSEAIVKRREPKRYRIEVLDVGLRKERTRKEVRTMQRAAAYSVSVPKIFGFDSFSIYMEKLNGKLLKDSEVGRTVFYNVGEMLGALHNSGIVHGDFTPANIMFDKGKLYVIDFGLSDMNKDDEERALDLLLMKRSISKDLYKDFELGYSKAFGNSASVLGRLEKIEERGRYQVRTLV